jgi:hypothetical protein
LVTEKKTPEIETRLKTLVEEETGGDPMSQKKWVRRTLRHLSQALQQLANQVSHTESGLTTPFIKKENLL